VDKAGGLPGRGKNLLSLRNRLCQWLVTIDVLPGTESGEKEITVRVVGRTAVDDVDVGAR